MGVSRFLQSTGPEGIVVWTRCQQWKWGARSVCGYLCTLLLMTSVRTMMETGIKGDSYI